MHDHQKNCNDSSLFPLNSNEKPVSQGSQTPVIVFQKKWRQITVLEVHSCWIHRVKRAAYKRDQHLFLCIGVSCLGKETFGEGIIRPKKKNMNHILFFGLILFGFRWKVATGFSVPWRALLVCEISKARNIPFCTD